MWLPSLQVTIAYPAVTISQATWWQRNPWKKICSGNHYGDKGSGEGTSNLTIERPLCRKQWSNSRKNALEPKTTNDKHLEEKVNQVDLKKNILTWRFKRRKKLNGDETIQCKNEILTLQRRWNFLLESFLFPLIDSSFLPVIFFILPRNL